MTLINKINQTMNIIKLKKDEDFMSIALNQAKIAFKKKEFPVGALIVSKDNIIISKSYNKVEKNKSQSKHAEIIAIEKACKKIGNWRLLNCTIYVTLEPCLMCMGLICLSRIERLVFGVSSLKFGYNIDNYDCPDLYKKHIKGIKKGVCSNKIEALLKQFFKKGRSE